MRLTKEQRLDAKLAELNKQEKVRLLYRLELLKLNKRLNGIFSRTMSYYGSFSNRRMELFHSFFDGNARNSYRYQSIIDFLTYSKNNNISDYLNATGMYAFTLFLRTLTEDYRVTGDYETSRRNALSISRKYFDYSDFQLMDSPIKIKVQNLDEDARKYVSDKIKNEIELDYLKGDTNIYKKIKAIDDDVYNANAQQDEEDDDYYYPSSQEEIDEILKEIAEEDKLKEEERARRYDPDYVIPDEVEDDYYQS